MGLSGIFSNLTISASGLRAQRIIQTTIASNLANVETTRTAEGGPYRRQFALLEAQSDSRELRLINSKNQLAGSMTQTNHLAIPGDRNPPDVRFFGNGVDVAEIRQDSKPPKQVYQPSHPDADEQGYVSMPNINMIEEMTSMISATRAYEANVTAFNAAKSMISQALQL